MVEQTPDDLLWAWYLTFGTRKLPANEIVKHKAVSGFPTPFWNDLITDRKLMAIDEAKPYTRDALWYITEAGIIHLQQESDGV